VVVSVGGYGARTGVTDVKKAFSIKARKYFGIIPWPDDRSDRALAPIDARNASPKYFDRAFYNQREMTARRRQIIALRLPVLDVLVFATSKIETRQSPKTPSLYSANVLRRLQKWVLCRLYLQGKSAVRKNALHNHPNRRWRRNLCGGRMALAVSGQSTETTG